MFGRDSTSIQALAVLVTVALRIVVLGESPWPRHTIDDTSRGADGTRLADVNGDGLLDIATPWEEGGLIRVYIHPGLTRVKQLWPAVTVGKVAWPEDAVLVDLDEDGAVDVVSACEGTTKSLFVHWAPQDPREYLNPRAWRTQRIPTGQGDLAWMYVAPLQIDGQAGIDLVCGAKGTGAQIGWLQSPVDPRDMAAWSWHPLRDAGWVMSIEATDLDADGASDLLISDRRGPLRGCDWLQNPGRAASPFTKWPVHQVGSVGKEAMFLWPSDLDQDGLQDLLVAVRPDGIEFHRQSARKPITWERLRFPWPQEAGTAKSVAVGDMNLDGDLDIVCSAEAARQGSGVVWLQAAEVGQAQRSGPASSRNLRDVTWHRRDISGPEGIKFDRVELLDLDADGDLDVLTSEERDGLGVVWYENPLR